VAQRVGRGIALLFHDRGTRRGLAVSSTPRPHFTPGKDTVPILQDLNVGITDAKPLGKNVCVTSSADMLHRKLSLKWIFGPLLSQSQYTKPARFLNRRSFI